MIRIDPSCDQSQAARSLPGPLLAGRAKDASRDAKVLGDAPRTDPRCFRALEPLDPVVVELREGSRMAEDLKQERNRLGNRGTGHDNRCWPVRFAPFPSLPSRLP